MVFRAIPFLVKHFETPPFFSLTQYSGPKSDGYGPAMLGAAQAGSDQARCLKLSTRERREQWLAREALQDSGPGCSYTS